MQVGSGVDEIRRLEICLDAWKHRDARAIPARLDFCPSDAAYACRTLTIIWATETENPRDASDDCSLLLELEDTLLNATFSMSINIVSYKRTEPTHSPP